MLILFKLSNENKDGIHGWFCSAVTHQKKGAALVWAGILWSQVESEEFLPNVMAQQSIRGQQSTRDRKKGSNRVWIWVRAGFSIRAEQRQLKCCRRSAVGRVWGSKEVGLDLTPQFLIAALIETSTQQT